MKTMKKNYFEPEMEMIELEAANVILAESLGDVETGDGNDGEYTGGSSGGANDPGFGGDY